MGWTYCLLSSRVDLKTPFSVSSREGFLVISSFLLLLWVRFNFLFVFCNMIFLVTGSWLTIPPPPSVLHM